MKKIISFAVVFCICACLFAFACDAASTSDAVEPIDASRECTLTINYFNSETSFADFDLAVYHVASVSADMQYTLTDTFMTTALVLNGIVSDSEWGTVRTTFESFVDANHPEPTAQKKSAGGSVTFEGLTPGLYFIMPMSLDGNGILYYFDSALIAVPGLDENGRWVYDVTANPKPKASLSSNKDSYKVVKLWRDVGNEHKRPTEITVDILRNGKTVKTVVLSAQNNWSFSWDAANKTDRWQVAEKDVPDGYVMTVDKHNVTFSIVNTDPDAPNPPPTGDTFEAGFYIALMCISGIVLIIVGTAMKKRLGSR